VVGRENWIETKLGRRDEGKKEMEGSKGKVRVKRGA
jgi:hypothetical protein